jgi:hypothetical protein
MRHGALVTAFLLLVGLVGSATAQEGEYRVVDNPFQDEFEYRIDTDLQPNVEVDGVRWTRFAIHIKKDQDIVSDKDMPVTLELEFVSSNREKDKVQVIVLLEDSSGGPLDRVECKPVTTSTNRVKESVQKFKLRGSVLEATRRVYLFLEVER